MRVGVVFPQTEIGNDPVVIRDFAQAAEELGYTHLLAYDHVLGAQHEGRPSKFVGPYTDETPFHEPLVLFGYLAAVTTRIELTTGILILPQRQTALVAKQAAEVDILSGGRLRLGIGLGWNYIEYESLNEEFANRGARAEEQVDLLRRLWAEPLLDYTGTWHRIDRASILPRPDRQIPIWFGGSTAPAFRRAARLGDGFILVGNRAVVLERRGRLRGFLEELGRDPQSFGLEAFIDYGAGPDSWRAEIEAYSQAGFSHLSMRTMGAGFTRPQQHIDALATAMAAIRES
jgi:probable F420-dependent oxidoreductase